MLTFALLTVPMMGFVGSAIDYSRANSAKASMQAAADATALMLSKEIATLTTAQINSKASGYFNALLNNNTDLTNVKVTPTYSTSGGSQVVVKGTGTVTTTFMKVVGFSSLDVDVSATVKWGNTRLRVALVLDNTGSMSSANKMNALKTAAKSLLDQLKNAATKNDDVYVSIVPFSKDVNVDPVNYNRELDQVVWLNDTWDENNGTCKKYSGNNCTDDKEHLSEQEAAPGSRQPHYLERLRHRPRPELRYDQYRAVTVQPRHPVRCRTVRLLPCAAPATHLRLEHAKQEDR